EDEHAADRRDREHDLRGLRLRRGRAPRGAARRAAARPGPARRAAARVRRHRRAARRGGARLHRCAGGLGDRRCDRGEQADVQAAARPLLRESEVLPRLRSLGFAEADAEALADHFLDAERRGKRGHGLARVEWLGTLSDVDPGARPERVAAGEGFERWEGRGALGYLVLRAICDAQLESPPERARVVVAADCFPTGMLGYWVRRLAEGGLVAALTATSPPRLAHPEGGPFLAGTNPLAIAIPSSDGRPVVAD